jgi:hypothetical protein
MVRDFMADITVKCPSPGKNPVKIIPFNDTDKGIAQKLEDILNDALFHENEDGVRGLDSLF